MEKTAAPLGNAAAMFRIKICGLTTVENARQVVEAGADAIGLNFYAQGSRYVPPAQAHQIAAQTPRSVTRVGVFVNASVALIRELVQTVPLDMVQLHGDESPDLAAEVTAAGYPVIRAVRATRETLAGPLAWLDAFHAAGGRLAGILVDAQAAGHYGGTGQRADWSVLPQLRTACPDTPLILAGGLNATNVAEAIRMARPDAVDTASGVESAPGLKDLQLVRHFVAESRRGFAAVIRSS